MDAETFRRISNLVAVGTVTQSKSADGISLCRVKIGERVTDFLPYMQHSSSFKRCATPVRVGEQVVVLHPFGDGDFGIVVGSIFNKGSKEPAGYSDTKEIVEFEDGTVVSYDTASKTLDLNAVGSINVVCKDASVQANSISVTATTSHSGDVTINGNLTVSGTADVGGNFTTGGTVTDSRGDLTNFSTTDGAARA